MNSIKTGDRVKVHKDGFGDDYKGANGTVETVSFGSALVLLDRDWYVSAPLAQLEVLT